MSRRMNDGSRSGIKADKYRNSRFEFEEDRSNNYFGGVSKATPNTLGGKFSENRGRRSADSERSQWSGSPFEDGEESSWKKRSGWDQYFEANDRGTTAGQARGNFSGRGPRGYKRLDKYILEDVCDTLSYSPRIDASEMEVSVENGIVYLKGEVLDRRMKKLAELEIENISGVRDVQNFLSIQSNDHKELH
jgi:hypothetical protein